VECSNFLVFFQSQTRGGAVFQMQFYKVSQNVLKGKVLRYVKPYKNIPFEQDEDIAVIQLDKAIDFDDRYTSPICLPPQSNHSFDPSSCIAVGFGHVDTVNGRIFFVVLFSENLTKSIPILYWIYIYLIFSIFDRWDPVIAEEGWNGSAIK